MRKTLRIIMGVLAVIAVLGLLFKLYFPSYTYRYQMTFEVEVDGRIHSGSSVIEVSWQVQKFIGPAASVRGQAALVDLGDKGILFMSLGGSGDPHVTGVLSLAHNAYHASGHIPIKGYNFYRELELLSSPMERVPLLTNNRPQFIWLPDRNDPATARPLKADAFSTFIAPNIRFHQAWVQTTWAPVTTDLAQKLPWVREFAQPKSVTAMPGTFLFNWANLSIGISL
jgi:hypothetical protein